MKVEEMMKSKADVFIYELFLFIIHDRLMSFFSDLIKAIGDFGTRNGVSVSWA